MNLRTILDRLVPFNSNRRMLLRTLREVAQEPRQLSTRLTRTNFANLLAYRRCHFDCPVCGRNETPLYDFPDLQLRREHRIGVLRETLQCRHCFASLRQRSLAVALLDHLNQRWATHMASISELAARGLGNLHILDSDNFSAMSSLLRGVPGYTRCSYLPDRPWGTEIEPGYFNIDLQRIDFPSDSFDVVLTSDVMEHVRDCDIAHAQIHRVLRPGGAYVFNVPFAEDSEKDIRLVDTSSEEDVFLCAPHYHGDPLTGGILAYRIFGRELIAKLENLGFAVVFRRIQQPSSLVIDGDVFVACKQRQTS